MSGRSGRFADSYLGQLRAVVGSRLLIVPGARIVVEDGAGRVLLQKRTDLDVWGFPGGGPELDDDIETAARRELYEEMGLTAHRLTPFAYASHPRRDRMDYPHGDAIRAFVLVFLVTEWSGEPDLDPAEAKEHGWFAIDAVPTPHLPSVPPTVAALARFRATGAFQLI